MASPSTKTGTIYRIHAIPDIGITSDISFG